MRLFQPHRNTGLVCLALMAGLPLFAQLAADPFPTSIRVETRAMTTTPQQAAADSVTLQELSHSVPSRARREMEKGRQAFAKHFNQEALVHLLRAVENDPEYVAARNDLAVVYMRMGNADAPVCQLNAAVQLDSYRAVLFYNLAVGYWMLNRYSDAEGGVTLRYQLANRAVMLSPTAEESSRASFERGTDAS